MGTNIHTGPISPHEPLKWSAIIVVARYWSARTVFIRVSWKNLVRTALNDSNPRRFSNKWAAEWTT